MKDYKTVCVMPGTVLGEDTPAAVVKDFFLMNWGVRITDIREIVTLIEAPEGGVRHDLIFRMHDDDVPKFAGPRLSTDIKWWTDWEVSHLGDYNMDAIDWINEKKIIILDDIMPSAYHA